MGSIVIIDDDADVRDIITFALENDGHKVLSFENGKVALEALSSMAKENLPGMLIVDYLMPEMDGATFIKEIRNNYPHTLGKIPVTLTSAMGALDPEMKDAENLFHLHKPMDLDDLLKLVRKHCVLI